MVLFILFFPLFSIGQHRFSKGHHKAFHNRITTFKKYHLKIDTIDFEADFILGNTNIWTGENYGYNPSLQALISMDNNKNFNAGAFFCLNNEGLTGPDPHGSDVFLTWRIAERFSLTGDIYLYLSQRENLESLFGYQNKIYYQPSLKVKYDLKEKTDLILSYSRMNNPDTIQQNFSFETDYYFNKHFLLLAILQTGTDPFLSSAYLFQIALGYQTYLNLLPRKPLLLSVSLNPFISDYADPSRLNIISVSLTAEFKRKVNY